MEITLELPTGKILTGDFPNNKLKLLIALKEIHRDELIADWKLVVGGQTVFKIEGLK